MSYRLQVFVTTRSLCLFLRLMQGWAAGLCIETSPFTLSASAIIDSIQACFNSLTYFKAVFGAATATIALKFGVPEESVLGLISVKVCACVCVQEALKESLSSKPATYLHCTGAIQVSQPDAVRAA